MDSLVAFITQLNHVPAAGRAQTPRRPVTAAAVIRAHFTENLAAKGAEAVHQARRAMLRAAIAVVRHGKDSVNRQDLADPFGERPLTYTKTRGGFQLQSQLVDREGNPVTLTVGPDSSS